MDHTHCLAPSRRRASEDPRVLPASFGRLFPELPHFAVDDAFLFALGPAGGLCDGQSDLVLHAPAGWQPQTTLAQLQTLDIDGP